jgi:hypothetical protein
MNAVQIIQRKGDVRLSSPREFIKKRIAESADKLSKAGQMAARVELANEALHNLVHLCYQSDTDGSAANVDRVTFRLLIPAPWGSSGWKVWGLRAWEGETLRTILLARQAAFKPGQKPPLFTYDEDTRSWHLNVYDYADIDQAETWLQYCPIHLDEWRQYAERYRQRRITARSQSRKKYPKR